MRHSTSTISSLLITAANAVLFAGCAASPVLERPDDASGSAQRNAPPAEASPYAQPPADDVGEPGNIAPSEETTAIPQGNQAERRASNEERPSKRAYADEAYAGERAPSAPSSSKGATASASESRSRGGMAYKSAPSKPVMPLPQVRPGLGTTWGESRTSTVRPVDFSRQNERNPYALFRLFYNDQTGILAQTGERSLDAFSPNYSENRDRFVSVEIVDPNGTALPGVYQNNNTYVLGRDGDRYAIRVRNHDRQRFEVVTTVDGLDVIDGTKGHFGKRGYILDPYGTLLIEGFRRSGNAVATFRFGSVADSYAARTSGDRNVGVIGVAVFAERGYEPTYTDQEIERRETADPFPSQYAQPPRPRRMYEAR